jgi:hypothetical protein
MADVNYAGVSNKEPKVSVSGIPQSQYNASAPGGTVSGDTAPAQGGGIVGNIKRHWPVYTVVLAIITIIVIIWVNNNNSTATTALPAGSTTDTTGTTPDMGSQLDADMQQMMSFQNQSNAFLQTLVNNSANTTTTPVSTLPSNSPALNMPAHGVLTAVTDKTTTLANLARRAGFKGGASAVYNYGNNAEIFANEGITPNNPNKSIPVGTIFAI